MSFVFGFSQVVCCSCVSSIFTPSVVSKSIAKKRKARRTIFSFIHFKHSRRLFVVLFVCGYDILSGCAFECASLNNCARRSLLVSVRD